MKISSIPILSACFMSSLIAIFVIFISADVSAKDLTPSEALCRVELSQKSNHLLKKKSSKSYKEMKHVFTAYSEDESAGIYVFSDDKECLFVSANDVAIPLIGYIDRPISAHGGDLEMPPALKWMLRQYANEIMYAKRRTTTDNKESFSDFRTSWTSIAPMCTTTWGQGVPFSNFCPEVDDMNCFTGCVATAMAQIMKYYQWPSKGRGQVSYVSEEWKLNLSMDLNVTFDWANMVDSYSVESPEKQKQAVANLMKACGYAIESDYSLTVTWANDVKAKDAFVEYFDYDSDCDIIDNYTYSTKDWECLIYENLKKVGPVLYSGSGPNGGHAFVCDGYSENGYFHINWGWQGYYDGYFLLSALTPSANSNYSFSTSAIIGLKPNDGTPNPMVRPYRAHFMSTELDKNLIMRFVWSKNYGDLKIGFGFSNERVGKRIFPAITQSDYMGQLNFPEATISEIELTDGIYRLSPAVSVNGSDWLDVELENTQQEYYRVEILDKKAVRILKDTLELKAEIVSYPNEIIEGKPYTVIAEINNPTDTYISKLVGIEVFLPNVISIGNTEFRVDLEAGEKTQMEFPFMVPFNFNSGTDSVYITLREGGIQISDVKKIALISDPLPTVVEAQIPDRFYNIADVGEVKIKIRGPYYGAPSFRIRDKETNEWIGGIPKSEVWYNLASGEEAIVEGGGRCLRLGTTDVIDSGEYILDFYDPAKGLSIKTFPITIENTTLDMCIYTNNYIIDNSWQLQIRIENNTQFDFYDLYLSASIVLGNNECYFDRGKYNFDKFNICKGEHIIIDCWDSWTQKYRSVGDKKLILIVNNGAFSNKNAFKVKIFDKKDLGRGDYSPKLSCDQVDYSINGDVMKCRVDVKCDRGMLNNPMRFKLYSYDKTVDGDQKLIEASKSFSKMFYCESGLLKEGDRVTFNPEFKLTESVIGSDQFYIEGLTYNYESQREEVFFYKKFGTGVSGINDNVSYTINPIVECHDNCLYIKNIEPDVKIVIYDLSGRLIFSDISKSQEIKVSSIDKGIYILKINSTSFKIMV